MLPNKKFSVAKDHGKSYINDTPSLDHHKIALGSCKNNRILKKILIPPAPTVLAPPPKRGEGVEMDIYEYNFNGDGQAGFMEGQVEKQG